MPFSAHGKNILPATNYLHIKYGCQAMKDECIRKQVAFINFSYSKFHTESPEGKIERRKTKEVTFQSTSILVFKTIMIIITITSILCMSKTILASRYNFMFI